MKKACLIIVTFLFFIPALKAQDTLDNKSPVTQFLIRRGYTFPEQATKEHIPDSLRKWPKVVYYNTVYKSKLMGSTTIPISFTKSELRNGKFEVSPTISVGFGYTWFRGDFIFNENDKITIEPQFNFGLVSTVGFLYNFTSSEVASVFAGGFIGFGNFNLFLGYDVIANGPSISLGGRIDLYTINQKFMKPIGKVHAVRKPKRAAMRIEYE